MGRGACRGLNALAWDGERVSVALAGPRPWGRVSVRASIAGAGIASRVFTDEAGVMQLLHQLPQVRGRGG